MIVKNNQSWVFIVLVKETTNGAVAKRTCRRKLSHLYLHKWKVIIPVTTSKLKQGPIIIMNYVNGLRLSVLKSPVMLLLSRESDHWDSFLLLSHHKYLFPSTLSLSACTYQLVCPYWSQRQEIFSGLCQNITTYIYFIDEIFIGAQIYSNWTHPVCDCLWTNWTFLQGALKHEEMGVKSKNFSHS